MLVKACLNGGLGRDDHPAVPITPEELAREARDSVEAGARALHIHPRAGDGSQTLEPEAVGAALEAIRGACPGVPIGVTTGLWVTGNSQERLDLVRAWRVLPDFASVNLSERGAEPLAFLLLARGIAVEAGVWSLEDARELIEGPLRDRCLRVLVEVPPATDAQAAGAAAAIDEMLVDGGVTAPQLHHGVGPSAWAVIREGLAHGRDIRVGLADVQQLPDGRAASGNGELVAAAVELARASGYRPSSSS